MSEPEGGTPTPPRFQRVTLGVTRTTENKADSFGYLNGRLVAVDYGN